MKILNTSGTMAPLVAVEGQVAPKATKAVTILARKSLQGEWKKPGAPPKDVIGLMTKNRKRGAFTKQNIYDLNGATVSMLTITKRIKDLRKAEQLVKMAEHAKHEGPGRPQEQFNFDLTKAAPKKTRGRPRKVTPAPEPVVVPAEAPAAAPVQAPEAAPVAPAPEQAPAQVEPAV
jgi:hypothetical protein